MLGQCHRRRANISPALGQRRLFDRLLDRKALDRQKGQCTERTKVKQHVPASVRGGDIIILNNKLKFFEAEKYITNVNTLSETEQYISIMSSKNHAIINVLAKYAQAKYLAPYSYTRYDISYASDWSRWSSR